MEKDRDQAMESDKTETVPKTPGVVTTEKVMNEAPTAPTAPTEIGEHLQHTPPVHLPQEQLSMAGSTTHIRVQSLGGADSTATEPEKSREQDSIMGPPQDTTILPPSKIQLGSSHQRRESRSLENGNTGQFELLSLRLNNSEAKTGAPLAKRALLKDKVEIGYHASNTPEITSTFCGDHSHASSAESKSTIRYFRWSTAT